MNKKEVNKKEVNKTTAYVVENILKAIRKIEEEIKEIDKISRQSYVVIRGETGSVLLNGKAERDAIINIITENRINELKVLEERLNDI